MAISSGAGGGMIGMPLPGEDWSASLLAGLPNLLMGIIVVSSELNYEIKGIDQTTFGYAQIAVISSLFLGVLFFNISKGWRRWSASWLVYMFFFVVILLNLAMSALATSITLGNNWGFVVQIMSFPLVLAYLLYKITCIDRRRGLLAAVPAMALIWVYFLESVPALTKSLAWGWLFMLAFIASVMMLRTRRFSAALGLAKAVPVLGGFPFAYLGVYMGGTLPFTQPGPSYLEVFRQYLPFMALVLTIALGPQLALMLRSIGRESAEAGGKIFYRLALGGILLGLALTLLEWIIVTGAYPQWMYILLASRQDLLVAAASLYLAGYLSLVWSAIRSGALSGDNFAALRLAALFILLPGVPAVIYLAIPNFSSGRPPYDLLPSVAGIVWVLAAAWAARDQKLN